MYQGLAKTIDFMLSDPPTPDSRVPHPNLSTRASDNVRVHEVATSVITMDSLTRASAIAMVGTADGLSRPLVQHDFYHKRPVSRA